jgi:hypothetical protein
MVSGFTPGTVIQIFHYIFCNREDTVLQRYGNVHLYVLYSGSFIFHYIYTPAHTQELSLKGCKTAPLLSIISGTGAAF